MIRNTFFVFIIYIFSITTDGWLSQWFVHVTLPARDKKYNYSYNDPSAKTEAGEDGPKIDRKQSAKKKSGELLAELLIFYTMMQKYLAIGCSEPKRYHYSFAKCWPIL